MVDRMLSPIHLKARLANERLEASTKVLAMAVLSSSMPLKGKQGIIVTQENLRNIIGQINSQGPDIYNFTTATKLEGQLDQTLKLLEFFYSS